MNEGEDAIGVAFREFDYAGDSAVFVASGSLSGVL
jgi:hypothetical protein